MGKGYKINKFCKPCEGTGYQPFQVEETIQVPPGILLNLINNN